MPMPTAHRRKVLFVDDEQEYLDVITRVLGQYSQKLPSNWKLYIENVKDPYHASILHALRGQCPA